MRALRHLRRLRRDETGATLVELALVIPLLLLLFFLLLDFGRLSHHWVMAEKAVQMAARTAAVRPPVECGGAVLPQTNARVAGSTARFGASCKPSNPADPSPCVTVPTMSCSGSATNPTSRHVFAAVAPLLPAGATPASLCFEYRFDREMNFLGGPYVPVVTVEIFQPARAAADPTYCPGGRPLSFQFASPLVGLARLAGAANAGPGDTPAPLAFPSMSVSLPGEDLNLGGNL